ncbi:hypothetical protein PAAG_01915 [Paracoccidioides lutzii Pb01]|uniref:Uncharacterized protein n=1 Tax=Paracoccidioides lutzii (strain ATCC MYA-826 / Pb01) TaxID=502779 RepID=C1GTS0_PARBA|nr:hypothetical protein PAAG_01915 [Paracoccidioides lutzii Pb01]EEH39726.2 hypothetical protein PAAG_01915 [Paracoccidioides lutzii Pb01]
MPDDVYFHIRPTEVDMAGPFLRALSGVQNEFFSAPLSSTLDCNSASYNVHALLEAQYPSLFLKEWRTGVLAKSI